MATFTVDREVRDQIVVVSLAGHLTTQTRELLHPILQQIAESQVSLVIVSLDRLERLDRGGLAALMLARRMLASAGSEVVLANVAGQPDAVITDAKLDQVIAVHRGANPIFPWRTSGVNPAMVLLDLFPDDDQTTVTGTLRDGLLDRPTG